MRGTKDFMCRDFYELLPLNDKYSLRTGQLYWSHFFYASLCPKILHLVQYDPREENCTFEIKSYSKGDEEHYPVKGLDLRKSELLYVNKGKKRPVVILGQTEDVWVGKDKTKQISCLCAPLYSFKDRHPGSFVLQVQGFMHPSLFYLPISKNGCTEESAIRLDMIHTIVVNPENPEPLLEVYKGGARTNPCALSKEATHLLLTHLAAFLGIPSPDKETLDLIDIYRAEIAQSISQLSTTSLATSH